MPFSNSVIASQKRTNLFAVLFWPVCVLALSFAGCQPKAENSALVAERRQASPPSPCLDSEGAGVARANDAASQPLDYSKGRSGEILVAASLPSSDKAAEDLAPSAESGIGKVPAASDVLPARAAVRSSQTDSASDDSKLDTRKRLTSEPAVEFPKLSNPDMANERISVNFDQVDIRVVLKTIGDITGINFIVDANVRGTVTAMFPTPIRLGDVYAVLESILEVSGYAAVPAADCVKIVPRAEAAKRNRHVHIGSDPSAISRSDAVLTQIIPLTHADAAGVSEIVKPLLPSEAYMAIYPKTNSILISDTSSNIHYLAKIIQNLDVEEQFKVIALKYASAKVLSEQIVGILQSDRGGASTQAQVARGRPASRIEAGVKILPDVRTNSLIVVANEQDTKTIERLVSTLDVERPSRASNVHVVYLKNAQAKQVAESLTTALANLRITGALEGPQEVQVSADEGTNGLIVTASAQDYEVIADIIEKLDIVREQVVVDMLIVEVSEDSLREIGIDWATLDEAVADSIRFFGATNFGPRVDFISGDLEGLAVGAWKQTGSGVGIAAILQALERKSGVNILSKPNVVTSNHNKARIVVGENIPFVMQSRITETDPATPTAIRTFEYRDVGIILEVTPHVSQGGLIRLEVNSEFTKFIDTGSLDTQRTTKREAQTNVTMNSGSTVVIGGLIRDDKVSVERKIPFVGDIPIVGELFKFRRDQVQKTNLLMFMTPHIVGGQEDLERITAEKKNEMEEALQTLNQEQSRR